MSYGYQGPPVVPFPGQKPPTSFGAPPGAPSAPSAPPHPQPAGTYGFPSSYGCPPTPFSPYSNINQHIRPTQNLALSPTRALSMPGYPQYYPPSASTGYSQTSAPQYYQQMPGYPPQNQQAPSCPSQYQRDSGYQPSLYLSPPSSSQANQSSQLPSMNNLYSPQSSSTNYPNFGTYLGGQGSGRQHITSSMMSNSYYSAPPSGITQTMTAHKKLSPTVVPYPDFDPREDAEVLRKAMKGFGTDEKNIINILCNRSNLQRQEIAHQFKTLYGKDLIKDLKSELSGKFEDLIVAMMTPLPQYYAKELHEAMAGVGTEESVLIEVLCTMSNHEIRVIRSAYEVMYGKSLEDDLRDDTSGSFKRLMVSLCCANRDETFNVDPADAMNDARKLLQAGELQLGTDESIFNSILVQRNIPQLKQIFQEYANITGHDIRNAIENEFSGDIKKGLLAIVKIVNDRAGFFAEQLIKSMKGMGTKDRDLIRLVVTRSEIDMGEIKQAFIYQSGKSLEDFISDDCSGHYKKCLLALIS